MNDIPNSFNGIYTEYPELHDQKSLSKKRVYLLKSKTDGAQFVQKPHDYPITTTDSASNAKKFHGDYLLITHWEWETQFEAVPV